MIGWGGQPRALLYCADSEYMVGNTTNMTWSGSTCSFYHTSKYQWQMNGPGLHMVIAFYAES